MEPLDRSTIWPYRDGEPGEHYYQRDSHPNGVAAEQVLLSTDLALLGSNLLRQQRWAEASLAFTRLVNTARTAADRAHVLYLEGRSHELRGAVATADRNFLQAYAAEPQGPWAPRALLSASRP